MTQSNVRVDLHIHTTASDGCWYPERVVNEAQQRGIGLLAVADHDTVEHVAPTEKLAREAGVAFLRGVELSARMDGYLFHILGYGIDTSDSDLAQVMAHNTTAWQIENESVMRGLIAAGMPFTWDEYGTYEPDPTLGGWKPLRFLVDRALCTGIDDYFDRLMPSLHLAPTEFAHPAQVIAAITKAGGVPVLAHPGASLRNSAAPALALQALKDMGLGGIECFSMYHDRRKTAFFSEWCSSHDLLITGGSDTHGGFVGRKMGVPHVTISDLELGRLLDEIRV